MFFAAAACGVAAAVVIAGSATAQQAQQQRPPDPRVIVTTTGGAQVPVQLANRSPDVNNRSYALNPGGSRVSVTGFSLKQVLGFGNVDTFGFSYAQIGRPGGNGAVILSRNQVLADSAFPDGPPVVYESQNGLSFLRPAGSAEDPNANDSFEATDGVIYLALKEGKLLDVNVTANPTRTKPGKPVKFSASVTQSGAGEALTYSWFFSDGSSAKGPNVTHRFKRPGSYNVVVGVTTPGDDVGASESVRVQVGKPQGGPNRTGGGVNDDSPLDSGPSVGGTGAGPISSGVPPVPSTGQAAPQGKSGAEPVETIPSGEMVEGRVLASADGQPINTAELPPASSDERAGARSGNPDGGGGGIPGVAWGLLGTMGLLGTGGLIELRGVRGLRTW